MKKTHARKRVVRRKVVRRKTASATPRRRRRGFWSKLASYFSL